MQIKRATEQDLPAILALYAQPEVDDQLVLPLDEARQIFSKMRSYPDYAVYIAEEGGEIVGTFALAIMDNLAHLGSKSGLIEDVAVDPARQGQGIGTQMMKYAIAVCKEKGCYKVNLSSNLIRQPAHEFYQNLGFKIHGYSFLMELEQGE